MALAGRDAFLAASLLLLSVSVSRRSSTNVVTQYAPPFLLDYTAALRAAFIIVLYGAMAHILLSKWRKKDVYLVDYACYRPPDFLRVPYSTFLEHNTLNGMSKDNTEFQRKILQHSGLSEQTALPPSFHFLPPRKGMLYSRSESQTVFFSLVDELLAKTYVEPSEIGILVLNCCLFYPSPSLSAMIVNRYKLRSDIKTFNLSGMGCAASLLAVDMVRHLLEVHSESYALILSSENMSGRDYTGGRRSMLIANCLFRMGGAAALLSNRCADKRCAKYKLLNTVRTHTASDDKSFSCITHGEDDSGEIGVSLSKELMIVAGDALTKNITSLGQYVLPISEQLKYAINFIARKYFKVQWLPYMPDFKQAFQHFCIHAGGKAVIQELEKNLKLTGELTEASRMTLHRFGNTSSTSVWYELAYLEVNQRVKKGERVWQVGLGSGFKCFSAVWKSLWDTNGTQDNPWRDCMLQYPVSIPDCVEI
ncbi:hypothetical protein GOP47_0000765 [Adiantum capillus-veneris]|uniref:3-ketoacyl-CoA synthase n=1 Tax=Adiantum capillus-veneris TaxID=13818 RepID=A0A9D4ZSL2_ADICA|nr:hypothetical protein GOP47_0000765 [Adiantum capillus-veneris]